MNKERPYREQAEKLRQKIDIDPFEEGEVVDREELPPRSRVHLQKRKKNKWKLKYPVIRLLVLFFILFPITIFSIYSSLLERPGGDEQRQVENLLVVLKSLILNDPNQLGVMRKNKIKVPRIRMNLIYGNLKKKNRRKLNRLVKMLLLHPRNPICIH